LAEAPLAPVPAKPDSQQTQPLVEALRPFIGQWVAVRDDDVLVAASSPARVTAWLAEHGQSAHSIFRVPVSDQTIGSAAPS